MPPVKETDDKMTSQREALETAKQMLHQPTGESEMDWDYYGIHAHTGGQLRQVEERLNLGEGND